MKEVLKFIIENKDFLFGGIGLFIIGGLFKFILAPKKDIHPKLQLKSRKIIKIEDSFLKAEEDINITGGDSIKIN